MRRDHCALAEAGSRLLHNHFLRALVEDERQRGDGRAPHEREEVAVEGSSGHVQELAFRRRAAFEEDLPHVVLLDDARLLGRHDDLVLLDGRVHLLQHVLVEVFASVAALHVLLERLKPNNS